MAMEKGLPVKGYTDQSTIKVDMVNANKELEERSLRAVDHLKGTGIADPRMLALGTTKLQEAWMWINRAVFQPTRVKLPEDE